MEIPLAQESAGRREPVTQRTGNPHPVRRPAMSAFRLDLHSPPAAISAPPELDSDCMEQYPPELEPGGLGMALEEELAALAGESLEDAAEPANGQDPDLLSLFRQKEKDLVLAAKLGKALLERNQELRKQYEKMNKELNEKLEHLEQEKHELRRRLQSREGEWEGRVAELEADVRLLQGALERQQVQLREADREKTRAVSELSEQNHRLLEQLSRAAEVERQLSTQVHSLRDDFREKNASSSQHVSRLESLQAEIKMLSERKRELERHVEAALEENVLLHSTVDKLRERTFELESQCREKDLQLRQSQEELQEVRLSHRQLSERLEEISEERSLQGLSVHTPSLLCEIEQSMEQEELEQEREQLRLQMWEAYCQVRSLCSHLRGNDVTDSALSTDSSMDESSETSSAKDVPTGSLHASLLELRRLTQNLLDGNESTGSRRSDEEALEDQVRKLSEELRTLRDQCEGEQEKARVSQEEVLHLHNQVALLSLELCTVREETEHLRTVAEVREPSEQLQSAIRDRDEAIAKKKAVEMELAKCKIDIMSLNSQLLDAIQQKLNLSQQLEAWQDDMHRVIDQQLMDQHRQGGRASSHSSSDSPARRDAPSRRPPRLANGDRKLFSFFKKN
ncbi:BICD family-like cargo adapter 1 isoform X1 [Brienomyrus brachyistius]|uniref:BICD family-like cargo adapter 1 isoform X1 n=1 Tax=Brienomyrus brachyistius TaxID=42636 RepID=UPI0020B202C7|nr:BICD family-like cargo adapter 1 isoform X1 [Brienomyrus brachyistius]